MSTAEKWRQATGGKTSLTNYAKTVLEEQKKVQKQYGL